MMQYPDLPIPYFVVNPCFQISFASSAAWDVFPSEAVFLDLLDEESVSKVKSFVDPSHTHMQLEANMVTKDSPVSLFQLRVQWTDELGSIVCINRQAEADRLFQELRQLSRRLESVNFDLYERYGQAQTAWTEARIFQDVATSGSTDAAGLINVLQQLVRTLDTNTKENVVPLAPPALTSILGDFQTLIRQIQSLRMEADDKKH